MIFHLLIKIFLPINAIYIILFLSNNILLTKGISNDKIKNTKNLIAYTYYPIQGGSGDPKKSNIYFFLHIWIAGINSSLKGYFWNENQI